MITKTIEKHPATKLCNSVACAAPQVILFQIVLYHRRSIKLAIELAVEIIQSL